MRDALVYLLIEVFVSELPPEMSAGTLAMTYLHPRGFASLHMLLPSCAWGESSPEAALLPTGFYSSAVGQ